MASSNSVSLLDRLLRKILITKFFSDGWGDCQHLRSLLLFRRKLSSREQCNGLVDPQHKVEIIQQKRLDGCLLIDGQFESPLYQLLPSIMPKECRMARFQMVLPEKWTHDHRPVCVHLAGTGDHGFWRRRVLLAKPLIKEAQIGSILLENPYYGCRKPKTQLYSGLQQVTDLFVMGGALILECIVLLRWCERMGFGPLGLTGVSMGGHMASLAASSWPKPISFVPCLSWSTASSVWVNGVMSSAVEWRNLKSQFFKESQLYDSKVFPLLQRKDEILRYSTNSDQPTKIESKTEIAETAAYPFHPMDIPPEVVSFMQAVMDECTHLGRFSPPVDTSLITAVVALNDGYVPRDGVAHLQHLWAQSEIRFINRGHIYAALLCQNEFRQAIVDSFKNQILNYVQ